MGILDGIDNKAFSSKGQMGEGASTGALFPLVWLISQKSMCRLDGLNNLCQRRLYFNTMRLSGEIGASQKSVGRKNTEGASFSYVVGGRAANSTNWQISGISGTGMNIYCNLLSSTLTVRWSSLRININRCNRACNGVSGGRRQALEIWYQLLLQGSVGSTLWPHYQPYSNRSLAPGYNFSSRTSPSFLSLGDVMAPFLELQICYSAFPLLFCWCLCTVDTDGRPSFLIPTFS